MPEIVAIVTPCFKAERWIEAAVRSVLAQTYPYWQHWIIADDGIDYEALLARSGIVRRPFSNSACVVKRTASASRRWRAWYSESFLISIAVAGFALAELEILQEDNQLLVRGKQKDDPGRQYLHRGIAARQFQRSFLLADGVEVKGAVLEHGMLVISVIRPKAAKLSRRIDIRSA